MDKEDQNISQMCIDVSETASKPYQNKYVYTFIKWYSIKTSIVFI